MSITVFVWDVSLRGVGHVSMSINGNTYISWWPSSKVPSGAWAATFKRDTQLEGRSPSWASDAITCLDEAAIQLWWTKLAGTADMKNVDGPEGGHYTMPGQGSYSLARRNCADVIIEGFKAGGMMKYPVAAAVYCGVAMSSLVMTPGAVRDIAIALSGDVGSRGPARLEDPSVMRTFKDSRYYGGI